MQTHTPMALHIVSRMTAHEDVEIYTAAARGVLREAGDRRSLSYTEERDGGEKVMTVLAWERGGDRLRLTCRGGVRWDALFAPGTTHAARYEVGSLAFDLTVRCREARLLLDRCGGEIRLLYDRLLGGDKCLVDFRLTAEPMEDLSCS